MQIDSKPDAGTSTQGARHMEGAAERNGVAAPQTWDPYEVWLQRVRRPRDSGNSAPSVGTRKRSRVRP